MKYVDPKLKSRVYKGKFHEASGISIRTEWIYVLAILVLSYGELAEANKRDRYAAMCLTVTGAPLYIKDHSGVPSYVCVDGKPRYILW